MVIGKKEKKNSMVKNYLKELGLERIESLEDINKLMQKHISTFAFSSMKVLLKEEISLDLNDIYEKLVLQKRGGYCFEHNKLFFEVLKELGFNVEFYLARVVNNSEIPVPQTHRFTLLHFKNERYIIDVGIGFRSPSEAIKFGLESTKTKQGVVYKIESFDDNTHALQIINERNNIFTVTKFDLNPCFEADFEMGHFYSHKHPSAVFVNNLVISLITENEIRSLRNREYFKIYKNSQEHIEIKSLEKFQNILKEDFNLDFKIDETEKIYNNFIN